jgi:hypothetical protein
MQTWRPFNGSCVTQCPDGFEDDIDEKNVQQSFLLLLFLRPIAAARFDLSSDFFFILLTGNNLPNL